MIPTMRFSITIYAAIRSGMEQMDRSAAWNSGSSPELEALRITPDGPDDCSPIIFRKDAAGNWSCLIKMRAESIKKLLRRLARIFSAVTKTDYE